MAGWVRWESLLELMRCSMNVEAIEAYDQLVMEKRRKVG